MRDRLQPPPPRRIRKHDGAKPLAIERAVCLHHVLAELRDDIPVRGLPRLHHFTRQHIGVDNHAPQVPKHRRHCALPRRDPPGEPHQQERPHA
jgi:hypothetical protein